MEDTYIVTGDEEENSTTPSLKLTFSEASSDEADAPVFARDLNSVKRKKLTFADMVVSAVEKNDDPKGASLPSIKNYLKEQYRIDEAKLQRYLKQSLQKCLETDKIVRCQTKNAAPQTGMKGRFKVPASKQRKAKANKEKATNKGNESSQKDVKRKTSPSVTVDKSKLKSLQQKSSQTKRARQMVKDARKSLNNSTIKQTTKKKPRSVKSKAATGKASSSKEAIVEVKKSKAGEPEKNVGSTKPKKQVKKGSLKPVKKVAKKKPTRKIVKETANKDVPTTSGKSKAKRK